MPDSDHPRMERRPASRLPIAVVFLSAVIFSTGREAASGSSPSASEEIRSLQEQIASARSDVEKIRTSFNQARAIEAWVSAAHPMQPLIVAIARSVSAPGAIKQLQLAREADLPGRVAISLELSDAPASQMEATLKALHDLGFREKSVTRTDADGTIKFDAVLVRKDPDPAAAASPSAGSNMAASVAPPPPGPVAGGDAPSLRATLRSLQDYVLALNSQAAETLRFAQAWQPYFALTTEAVDAEKGIAINLGKSELGVTFSSFKIVDCHPLYPRWSEAMPQVSQGEVVIEDNYAKGINWLGMMERVKPAMRICRVSMSRAAAPDECRFDLVLEVPLLQKSPD